MKKSSSVGFFDLLALLFIGLKLAGFIDWSWWWVLSPFVLSFLTYCIDRDQEEVT